MKITPVIVIPDTSPLIHLAAVNMLTLLHEFGKVIVMDIVAYEASSDLNKPWAIEINEWLKNGQTIGSKYSITVSKTEIGEAYRLARLTDPNFKLRNAGENAIRDWLIDMLPEIEGPVLVIYEDKKLPKIIQREQVIDKVVMATTRAVLAFAEERQLITSAEEVWNNIVKQAKGANPNAIIKIIQSTKIS